MALSAKRIEKLRKTVGRYRDDGDGGVHGLYLNVPWKKGKHADKSVPGGASWLLRYNLECEPRITKEGSETNRRERWIGLGSADVFTLKEARDRARAKRQLLADGIDPLVAKAAAKTAKALAAAKNITFKKAAEQYIDQNAGKWKNAKHRQQWTTTLETYAFPVIGDWPIADVDVGAVLKVLEQQHNGKRLWDAIAETASRLRGRIESVLDWAKVRGYRSGDNPASWDLLKHAGLPARGNQQHHPCLPYAENNPRYPYAPRGVASFVAALRKQNGIAARALEFLVLTATRTGAVTGMKWDEVDFTDRVWTVPPRLGTKVSAKDRDPAPRYVPLSNRAIEILKALPREEGNPYVFIGAKAGEGLPEVAMSKLMTALAFNSTTIGRLAVVHGCRSSFTDWVADCTAYPNSVADAALWHVAGGATDIAYRRSDLYRKRVRLMEDWSRYVGSPPASSAKVVALRGR
jgi:integrase